MYMDVSLIHYSIFALFFLFLFWAILELDRYIYVEKNKLNRKAIFVFLLNFLLCPFCLIYRLVKKR